MRVLVIYHSETSNTEKVAQAIHQEASKEHEAHLKKIGEADPRRPPESQRVRMGEAQGLKGSPSAREAQQFKGRTA